MALRSALVLAIVGAVRQIRPVFTPLCNAIYYNTR